MRCCFSAAVGLSVCLDQPEDEEHDIRHISTVCEVHFLGVVLNPRLWVVLTSELEN